MKIRNDIDGILAVTKDWTDTGLAVILDHDYIHSNGYRTMVQEPTSDPKDVHEFASLVDALNDFIARLAAI